MAKAFQTLTVIPENVVNASRFGPGFSIGATQGSVVRDEHQLLLKVAAMACFRGSDDALSTDDVRALVGRVQDCHGVAPETLIANLQDAGDRLLSHILNASDLSEIRTAYLDTMVALLALSR